MNQDRYAQVADQSGSLYSAAQYLEQLLARHPKVAVTGRPGIGKTAVVDKLGPGWWSDWTLHTDRYANLPWDEQSKAVINWASARRHWLMEGVTVARALRHGLDVDVVLMLTGMPLKSQNTIQSMRLGDSVVKWVEEARQTRPIAFHFWRVVEPKRC
jgi:hypothetical protein